MSLITKEIMTKGKITEISLVNRRNITVIHYKCDSCGTVFNMRFSGYCIKHKYKYKQIAGQIDTCVTCKNKIKEDMILYTRNKKRYDKYRIGLENYGFILLTPMEDIKEKDKLEVICLKHKDIGIQTMSKKAISQGIGRNHLGCKHCKAENTSSYFKSYWETTDRKMTAHHNPCWRGGVTQLRKHFRSVISPWITDSFKSSNWQCYLSGSKGKLVIHHLYPFHKIFDEVFESTGLPIKQNIGEYSEDELDALNQTCLQLHYKYGLGVCIRKDLHTLFHSRNLYGSKYFTPEQFEEFTERYNNGEFKEVS